MPRSDRAQTMRRQGCDRDADILPCACVILDVLCYTTQLSTVHLPVGWTLKGPRATDRPAYCTDCTVVVCSSFGLALSFLLIILGRACTASLWDVSPSSPAAKVRMASTAVLGLYTEGLSRIIQPGTASGPTIAFPRLTRAMLTRTARFVLPVLVIAAALWGLGASNATKDCNTAGMQQPYWNLIRSFSGYMTIVFNCFSAFSYQTQAAQYFAGNLWTNAWFFQASFCVYICHMMLGNLSSARHWTYILLIFFMWTTYQYFAVSWCAIS